MVNFFKKWAYLGGVSVIFFDDLGGVGIFEQKNAKFKQPPPQDVFDSFP